MANIFLHYVLDDWFVQTAQPRLKGRSFIIRGADDFIIGCEVKSDAQRIMKALVKRFEKFKLSLNMEKTKLVPFMKPGKSGGHIPETFDYLGFTFYWGKSLRGYWVIKKKTAGKRLKRFIKAVWRWCKENRHEAITEQYEKLCQKLRGYYQYFGVISNYEALAAVFEKALKSWQFWLSRRSHKGKITWEKFKELKERFPLPRPRIIHNI